MKKYGPFHINLYKSEGIKPLGEADDNEKGFLLELFYDDLQKVFGYISKEDFKKATEKLKVVFCKYTGFGSRGICSDNKIMVSYLLVNYINSKDKEAIRKDSCYSTLAHELIHYIQHYYANNHIFGARMFKGQDLIGLIEGGTEFQTNKMLGSGTGFERNNCRFNFPSGTAYLSNVVLMSQLEVLYGKELVDKFCFKSDKTLIETIYNDLGKDFTYKLIKATKLWAFNKKNDFSLDNIQNELMKRFFEKRFNEVKTEEQATRLLNKLKDLGNQRMYIKESDTYENFYNSKLDLMKKRFPDLNIENNKFVNPNMLPIQTIEMRKTRIEYFVLQNIISIIDNDIFNYNPDYDDKHFKINNISDMKNAFINYDFNNIEVYNSINGTDMYYVVIDKKNDKCTLYSITGTLEEKMIEGAGSQSVKINDDNYEMSYRDRLNNNPIKIGFNSASLTLSINGKDIVLKKNNTLLDNNHKLEIFDRLLESYSEFFTKNANEQYDDFAMNKNDMSNELDSPNLGR